MGAIESPLESEYFEESLATMDPSQMEFDFWINLHQSLKNSENISSCFTNYQKETENIKLLSSESYSNQNKMELIKRLDNTTLNLVKLLEFCRLGIGLSMEVFNKCFQEAYFDKLAEESSMSKISQLFKSAEKIFTEKMEIEKFQFDFKNFKASLYEVLKYLVFQHDCDDFFLTNSELINDFYFFKRIFLDIPGNLRASLKTKIDDMNAISDFLSKDKPAACLFCREILICGSSQISIILGSLSRLIIICSNTLLKNNEIEKSECVFLMKCIVSCLIIHDELSINGVFDELNKDKVPFLMAVQVLGKFASSEGH